ncbi:MAG: hypothetical protein KDA41_02365, partial [Planctomycetales bacterium]|nr:hypothetical protein [Planctomycetales bacterium]
IAVSVAASLPTYFWIQRGVAERPAAEIAWWQPGSLTLVVFGLIVTIALGVVFTWLPLAIGFRAFRKLEF